MTSEIPAVIAPFGEIPALIVPFEPTRSQPSAQPAIWLITKEKSLSADHRFPLGYYHLHAFHSNNRACAKLMKLANKIKTDHPE
jgi:hypothetical protein